MICQQMTGSNAINLYALQIFKSLGIKGTATNLFATSIYGIAKTTICAVSLLFAADSLDRRRSLLGTSIAQGTAMFYFGLYVRIDPPATATRSRPPGMWRWRACSCSRASSSSAGALCAGSMSVRSRLRGCAA